MMYQGSGVKSRPFIVRASATLATCSRTSPTAPGRIDGHAASPLTTAG